MNDSTDHERDEFATEPSATDPRPTEQFHTEEPPEQPLAGPLAPDATRPVEQDRARRPPARMSTVVWGLIIVVVGAGILARALGAEFDNELALIVLLCAAGVALVATSIISAVRKK